MNDRDIRRLDRALRVQTFGRDNATDFAPGSKATALFQELNPIISALAEARVGQLRQPVGKEAIIEALSDDFKDIARTARAILLDEPSFPVALYRHPRTYVETPVATHADALLQLLEDQPTDTPAQLSAKSALRAKFIAYELPADFVDDLRADREALTACNEEKHSDLQGGVESTASIDSLLAQAQTIITRLGAAVKNKYARVPEKLAAWKSASRTERQPKPNQPTPTPPVS